MARLPHSPADASGDAAALLRRLGFALLFAGAGVSAYLARSGLPLLLALGAVLLAVAAVLDGANRPWRSSLARIGAAPALVAVALLLGWSALSILWTPALRPAAERGAASAAVVALALVGYLGLPDRMRSANLYLAPIGTALAAVLLVAVAVGRDDPAAQAWLARGLAVIVLLVWPSVAWLRSRARDREAVGLAVIVAGAAATLAHPGPILALAAGAIGYLAAQLGGRAGALAVGFAMAGLALFAPVILAFAAPLGPWTEGATAWREALLSAPIRLLTGHGLEALARAPWMGRDAVALPGARLLALWYEAGVVGVLALCAAIVTGLRSVGASWPVLLPGVAATVVTAFGLALSGLGRGETWWAAALALTALAFVMVERGQFRTRRPRLPSFARMRGAPARPV